MEAPSSLIIAIQEQLQRLQEGNTAHLLQSPQLSDTLNRLHDSLDQLESLSEELQHQNQELRRSNQTLCAENHHHQTLFKLLPGGYLITDSVGAGFVCQPDDCLNAKRSPRLSYRGNR